MAGTTTRQAKALAPAGQIADAVARMAEAEARVAALTRQVFVEMPAEQRELQASLERAQRANNNAAFIEARSALDSAKRRRNATIDQLEAAKGDVVQAKAAAVRLQHAERRRETLARAEALGTATHADLLEEQRQIPDRLAHATRDLDLEQVQALRRRLDELPGEIYAARLTELGRAVEQLRVQAAEERRRADALGPELEAAEERFRQAREARDRLAAEISVSRIGAQDAERGARARESEIDQLAAQTADAWRRTAAMAGG